MKVDSGDDAHDRLTSQGTLTVGGLAVDATWRYSVNGGKTWTVGEGHEIPAGSFSEEGPQTVLVEQIDRSGVHSAASSFDFTLDTRAPLFVVELLHDTGASASADPGHQSLTDRETRDATVVVDGLEAGRPWEYSLDGVVWQTGHGQGIDSAVFGPDDGAKFAHVRQTDAAGNVGEQTLQFDLDRVDPAAPVIRAIDANSLTGHAEPGNASLTSIPQVAVTAAPGVTWGYEFDTGQHGSGTGTALTPFLQDLPEGARSVVVTVEDGAGNARASTFNFTLDRTPPGPLTLALVNDTGASASDGITQDGTMQVGDLQAGCQWYYRVTDAGAAAGAWTRGDDAMTIPTSALGADGEKRVDGLQVDAAGNVNEGDMRSLTIDLDRHADAPVLALKHDTGGSAGDYLTTDSTVSISGLERGASWLGWSSVDHQNGLALSMTMDAAGTSGEALVAGSGTKELWIRQTDLAGNVSTWQVLDWLATTEDAAAATAPVLRNIANSGGTLMHGTQGGDTFMWDPKTIGFTPIDVVTNYKAEEGDVLDLSGIVAIAPGRTLSDYVAKFAQYEDHEVMLAIHAPESNLMDYEISLWNTSGGDPVRVKVGDDVFTI
ncbi:type I secretion C-terminal target domain-containing protein [Mitsuaria sp. CC2]|uniref:type I secretion C-terminal target domain-containing protein n=1 Tax=Mitsuaria sp. CC2 TaxID=3029186 RepID=UPI003B8C7B7E